MLLAKPEIIQMFKRIAPVSYTHLDVYKRQVYGLGTGMETGSMYSQKTENCWHTLMGTCISLPDSGRIGTTCMWQSGEAALQ